MTRDKFTRTEYWLLAGILFCLLPYFLISFYVQPSADDFFFAAWFREKSLTGYMHANLTCCNGRYTGILLAGLTPLSFGSVNGMKLIPIITLSALFMALRFVFISSTDQRSFRTTWLWPSIAMLLVLNAFPSTAEGIYWVNASIFHTWAAILILVMAGLIALDSRKNLLRGIAGSLIAFVVPGLNEIAAVLLGIILVLHVFNTMFSTSSRRMWALAWLVLLLTGSTIVLMLPGTWQRVGELPGNLNIGFAFSRAFVLSGLITGQQLQQLPLLLFSLLLLPRLKEISIPAWDHCKLSKIHWLFLPAASLLTIYSLYFIALFLLGNDPPWRVHNNIAILFQVLWFLNLYHIVKQVRVPKLPKWSNFAIALLAFWFILSDINLKQGQKNLSFRGNTTRAWYELLVEGPSFQDAMDERYHTIYLAGPEDTVVVPQIEYPTTIIHADIGPDPGELYNAITAYYFDVAAIRTEIPEENE